jgi:hypothetical protein
MKGKGDDIMKESRNQRYKKIEEIKEKDIDYSDIPELDDSFWDNATISKYGLTAELICFCNHFLIPG